MTQDNNDLLTRLETMSLLIGTCDHACAVTVRDAITTIKAQREQLLLFEGDTRNTDHTDPNYLEGLNAQDRDLTSDMLGLSTFGSLVPFARGRARAAGLALRVQAEELKALDARRREAEARYTVLLLDLLSNDDITISRASELTRVSVADIRRWSRDTFTTGQQTTFPFPAKRQEVQP
ncbi:hypothetical protein Q0M94_12035 [Deinococcus radiomollis]|uniref:hypothetical protein n=1 Tax=Deinococcus radiomollis TaxID=468916 RepID=UPI003891AE98